MSTTQNSDQQTQNQNKWQKLGRDWAYTRLGHEGMMLDKLNRQNRIVEVLARNAATGDVSDVSGWPESDDMGVNIGNEIHYHGGNPASPAVPAQQPPQPSLSSKLWPWALAAAAGLSGFGLQHLSNRPAPPAASVEFPPFPAFPQYDVEKWIPGEN